jgi:hypothetical protein
MRAGGWLLEGGLGTGAPRQLRLLSRSALPGVNADAHRRDRERTSALLDVAANAAQRAAV